MKELLVIIAPKMLDFAVKKKVLVAIAGSEKMEQITLILKQKCAGAQNSRMVMDLKLIVRTLRKV